MRNRLITLFVLPFLLSGCAAAVGGAALGVMAGYTLGKDERDGAQIVQDTEICAQINRAYFSAPNIDSLQVKVASYKGEVTLTGTVPSEGVKQRAIQIAQHTHGVTRVVSRLEIVPPENWES